MAPGFLIGISYPLGYIVAPFGGVAVGAVVGADQGVALGILVGLGTAVSIWVYAALLALFVGIHDHVRDVRETMSQLTARLSAASVQEEISPPEPDEDTGEWEIAQARIVADEPGPE